MPILGIDEHTGERIELTSEARQQGVYLIGTTGTGKTTLLSNIVYQDMIDPARPGICVIDPHGDFVDGLLDIVPPNRKDDVILFAPGDPDQFARPLGLNLLECDRNDPRQRRRVISTVVDTLHKLFAYSWGPRMEDLLRHSVYSLMETPDTTLLDMLLLLASPDHRERYTAELKDPVLRHYWQVQFAAFAKNAHLLAEVVGSSLNKIGRFLADPIIRNVVSQPTSAINMRTVMDEGQILLVNLSKGDLGEDNSALLGSVLINLVLIAALQRRDQPQKERRPFHLIVDECQSVATESLPTLLSEGRKYGINTIAAHQFRDQLDDLGKGAMLNAANILIMRISGQDGLELASQFDNTPPPARKKVQPVYRHYGGMRGSDETLLVAKRSPEGEGGVYHEVDEPQRLYSDVAGEMANQLSTLADYTVYCRVIERDAKAVKRLVEHVVTTDRPLGEPNQEIARHIRATSSARGTSRQEVEASIKAKVGDDLGFDIPPFDFVDR